jgi:hypothetical protein
MSHRVTLIGELGVYWYFVSTFRCKQCVTGSRIGVVPL